MPKCSFLCIEGLARRRLENETHGRRCSPAVWSLQIMETEVLVHKGTVEERMSRHRTRSVLGVSYENVDANSLMKSPESALGEGSAFFQRKRLCSSFRELDQQYETALGKTLSDCVELSRRVAKSMLRGKKCREAKLSEIRRWLRGESSPGTEDPEDEAFVGKESIWKQWKKHGNDGKCILQSCWIMQMHLGTCHFSKSFHDSCMLIPNIPSRHTLES